MRPVLRIAFLVLALTAQIRAQTTNASVAGSVVDPSQAVITDAAVAAINADTNTRHASLTNNSGEYRLTNLPPGVYRMEIEKQGFRRLIKPDVAVHVQDAIHIDFEMTIGSRNGVLTVEAGAPLVNTESAAVSTVVDHRFVENLPLNGR